MAKDVAWNCPYKDGITKPTAAALEKHMGDHHRAALRKTIEAGLKRADKRLDAIVRRRARAEKKVKARAATARSKKAASLKAISKPVRVRAGSEDARMAAFSKEFI